MPKLENPILMAVIGAAHGVAGAVRIKPFTGDPMALADYGTLFTRDGKAMAIASARPAKDMLVVQFKGVAGRDAAEALTGTELFLDRSAFPTEEEDEFYHADLVGLAVQDLSGERLGTVTAVQNFGGGDLLELTVDGRAGILIPFTKAAAPTVDVKGGFVEVDPVAAGLAEDEG